MSWIRNCVMFPTVRRSCSCAVYRGVVWPALFCTQPLSSSAGSQQDSKNEVPIPEHVERQGETVEVLRARLQYQSRKRGTLENGLLLSFTEPQLTMYDQLINKPSDEWDIFYWATGKKPVPAEYDNEVMSLLIEFTKNIHKESRITQPPVQEIWK